MTDKYDIAFGKVSPQAVDFEEVVLGACLQYAEGLNTVVKLLKPEHFYKDDHKQIYEAILALNFEGKPVDILTVCEHLKKLGTLDEVGGMVYIADLTSRTGGHKHTEYHCKIILEKYIGRFSLERSNELANSIYDQASIEEQLSFMNEWMKETGSIIDSGQKSSKNMKEIINQSRDDLDKRIENFKNGLTTGISSGFKNLDDLTGNWQSNELIIIGARPAMGKTAIALQLIDAATKQNKYVDVYSLEMDAVKLMDRLIIGKSGVPSTRYKRGDIDDHEYEQLAIVMSELRDNKFLTIDDRANTKLSYIRSKAILKHAEGELDLILIDYLQLMDNDVVKKNSNREQEVAIMSRGLKLLAKELGIPIIVLCQLNRNVESRKGDAKKPMLSDLRESGSVEQDADKVIFLHRPEYYDIIEDSEGNSLIGIMDVIVAKNREGAIGKVNLSYNESLTLFREVYFNSTYEPNPNVSSPDLYLTPSKSDEGLENNKDFEGETPPF